MTPASGPSDAAFPPLLNPEGFDALAAMARGSGNGAFAGKALGALSSLRSASDSLMLILGVSLTAERQAKAFRNFDAFDRAMADLHERIFALSDEAAAMAEASRREARRPSHRDRRRLARLFVTPAGSVRAFLPRAALAREEDGDLLARLARSGLVDEVADGYHLRDPGREEVRAASPRLVRLARRAAAVALPHVPAFALGVLAGLLANLVSRWIGL